MGEFSLTHILILAIIVLIFFGPSRLPGLGKSIGQAIRGFKQGINDINADSKDVTEVKPPAKTPESLPSTAAAEAAKNKESDKTKSENHQS